LEPIAPYIEWLEFSSDLGTQSSLFTFPATFRDFFKEPFRQMVAAVKKVHPSVKIFLHSCDAIFDIIPDLIEIGLDILNPLPL